MSGMRLNDLQARVHNLMQAASAVSLDELAEYG
jgi:hypothetical protein